MKEPKQIETEVRIKLGICAMEKKVNSKHMQNILKGLEAFDEFDLIIFDEDTIFNKEMEDWPVVDSLIIFFSNGFPYSKALKYLDLRKPFLINDFEIQKVFWDRRKIYRILEENNIPTPNHIMMDRGEEINNDNLKEDPNAIEEIEKMIYQYTELAKELKEENKRKNTKRGDSFIEPREFSGHRFSGGVPEEKIIEAESVSSLVNLEDNYYEIKNSVTKNCFGSSRQSSQKKMPNFDLLPKSNSETANSLSKNLNPNAKSSNTTMISIYDHCSEPYGIDKETFQNTHFTTKEEELNLSNQSSVNNSFVNGTNNHNNNIININKPINDPNANNSFKYKLNLKMGQQESTKLPTPLILSKPQTINNFIGETASKSQCIGLNEPSETSEALSKESNLTVDLELNSEINLTNEFKVNFNEKNEKCDFISNAISGLSIFTPTNVDNEINLIKIHNKIEDNQHKDMLENSNLNNIPSSKDFQEENNNNSNNKNENNNNKNTSDFVINNIINLNVENFHKENSCTLCLNPDTESSNETPNNIINNNNIPKKHSMEEIIENEDFIEYKGKKIFKPFVEKPCNGDDHNIYIYYPPSIGSGHKRLFRKTKNLSSLYIPNEDEIRREKSYIYEEFLQTDGFDIKVYTIGPEYFHAEARKAPSLDGVVRRSPEGKEVRYPVNLTPYEKEISRKIVQIFKQNVCGFDILRSKGKSYVCDVNGWSFVKGNRKYYEDCVVLIRKMILMHVDPKRYERKPLSLQIHVPTYEELILPHRPKPQNQKYEEELRSVVSIFRHGDRSPKQKMKLVVTEKRILNLYQKYSNNSLKEIKLKKPKQLMEVLNLTQEILSEHNIDDESLFGINDTFINKIIQLKMVLEKNVNFEGMTRKVQIKPLKFEETLNEKGKKEYKLLEALFILKWGGDITHSGIEQARLLGNTFRVQIYPNYIGEGDGLLRLHSTYRHDLKCYSSEEGRCMKTAAAFLQGLLQLDGNLIPIISSMVRKDDPVLDMLDVSSDEIFDLKKKVKDELSECLHHDGNLLQKFKNYFKNRTIVQSKDEVEEDHSLYRLMDKIKNPFKMMNVIYNLMDKLIQYIKTLLTQEEIELDSGTYLISRPIILQRRKTSDHCTSNCETRSIYSYRTRAQWESLFDKRPSIKKNIEEENLDKPDFDCEDEKVILIYKRWIKLYQDFYSTKKQLFDISKIPDIYDNIKYDLIHNKHLLNDDAYNLFYNINSLANFVMPLEYGITVDEKVKIGLRVIGRLLNKIHNDLLWWFHSNNNQNNNFYAVNNPNNANDKNNIKDFDYENESYSGLDRGKLNNDIKSAWRHVKTRFYFTSASHLYSLINTIIFGIDSFLIDLTDSNQIFIKQLKNVLDLDYLSHIMFRLYENFNYDFDDPKRFRLEIIMSPGSNKSPPDSDEDHLIPISPWIILNKNLTLKEMEEFFSKLKKEHHE